MSKKWTYNEICFLKENWGNYSFPYLSKKLNRTVAAIKEKAYKIGLKRMIHSGDYITYNQLLNLIYGSEKGGHRYDKKLIKAGFPIETITIVSKKVKVVYMHKFWKWFEKNKHLIDLSKTDEYTFGYEPSWVAEKRSADKRAKKYKTSKWTASEDERLIFLLKSYKYGYRDLSKLLCRTEGAIKRRMISLKIKERPLKADNHILWTKEEINKVKELYLKGYKSCIIAEYVNKSALAINGIIERHNFC